MFWLSPVVPGAEPPFRATPLGCTDRPAVVGVLGCAPGAAAVAADRPPASVAGEVVTDVIGLRVPLPDPVPFVLGTRGGGEEACAVPALGKGSLPTREGASVRACVVVAVMGVAVAVAPTAVPAVLVAAKPSAGSLAPVGGADGSVCEGG